MDEPYLDNSKEPKIPLPDGWTDVALDALLHVIALARLAIINARNWPPDAVDLNVRAKCDRLESENALLGQELAIKDARFSRIPSHKRPAYLPSERLQILMLKSALGLNNTQLSKRFHVSVQTIRTWFRRLRSNDGLLEMPEQVTRYPDYLRCVVQQLKATYSLLGRQKVADILARTGLHMSGSTVGRIVNEPPIDPSKIESPEKPESPNPQREIIANYSDHVWSLDFTEVPTETGFWVPWKPNSITQCWPYCWHVLNLVDHFSRRSPGMAVFDKAPTSEAMTAELARIIDEQGCKPKHIVVDHGPQFDCEHFRDWCKGHGIKYRYGALGQHGSLAVVERFNRSMKDECTRRIMVPTDKAEFESELSSWRTWYNIHRPHMRHEGRTPRRALLWP